MVTFREARDEDSDGLIRLVGACFAEYPGCVLDVEAEEPELLRPADAFDRYWVMVEDGQVVGCCACAVHERDGGTVVELKKMYLYAEYRGQGRAERLAELVEERAREVGATGLILWSDTRFTRAHGFYLKIGYARTGRTRDLHDLSNTTEFEFEKGV